jgi:hypothetical protein
MIAGKAFMSIQRLLLTGRGDFGSSRCNGLPPRAGSRAKSFDEEER